MKRWTYNILTHIPIVGGIVKIHTEPMISGSLSLESGFYDKCSELLKEYLKTHPDEQVTRQLIDRLLAEDREKNK